MDILSSASRADAQKVLREELTRLGAEDDSLAAIDVLVSDFWRNSGARTLVQHAVGILKHKAPLLRLLNIVLETADTSLAVTEDDPELPSGPISVVLITQNGTYGEVLRFPPSPDLDSVYMTTASLRSSMDSEEFNRQIQDLPSSLASCIMDLLLLELKLPASPTCKRTCNRHLRYLSDTHGVLPPSLLLYGVEQDGRFPTACGGFADIYKGRLKDSLVCLKVLRYFSSATPMERERLIKLFCREALAWKRLDHPNILPFIGIAADLFHPSFCLISPWMSNGNIMSFLEENPTFDRLKAITEIAQAVKYLHGHDPPIVHADIRGANILVTNDLRCCLTDFGLTSVSETRTSSNASQGTLRWMAPEYLQADASPMSSPPRDIYAFGCTVLEIYTGKPPFHYLRNDGAVLSAVVSGKRPSREDFQPDCIWPLIESCWHQESSRRPSAQQILRSLASMTLSSDNRERRDLEHYIRASGPDIIVPETPIHNLTNLDAYIPSVMDPIAVDFRAFYPYTPNEVKHRKRQTSKQLEILEGIFKRDTKPNAALRNELAAQLYMSARGVQVWFQNRRAKERSKNTKTAAIAAQTTSSATMDGRLTGPSMSSSHSSPLVAPDDSVQSGYLSFLDRPPLLAGNPISHSNISDASKQRPQDNNLFTFASRHVDSPIPGPLPAPGFSFGAASTSPFFTTSRLSNTTDSSDNFTFSATSTDPFFTTSRLSNPTDSSDNFTFSATSTNPFFTESRLSSTTSDTSSSYYTAPETPNFSIEVS